MTGKRHGRPDSFQLDLLEATVSIEDLMPHKDGCGLGNDG